MPARPLTLARDPDEPWVRPLWGGANCYIAEWGEWVRSGGWSWHGPVTEEQDAYKGPQVHLAVRALRSYGRGRWKLRAYVRLQWHAVGYAPDEWKGLRPRTLAHAKRMLNELDLQAGLRELHRRCWERGQHACTYRVLYDGNEATLEPHSTTPAYLRGYVYADEPLPPGRYLRVQADGRLAVIHQRPTSTTTAYRQTLEDHAEHERLPLALLQSATRWGDPVEAL